MALGEAAWLACRAEQPLGSGFLYPDGGPGLGAGGKIKCFTHGDSHNGEALG